MQFLHLDAIGVTSVFVAVVCGFASTDVSKIVICLACLGLIAYSATVSLVPVLSPYLVRRGVFGHDINKKGTEAGTKKIPESLGIVCGIVYYAVSEVQQLLWYINMSDRFEQAKCSKLFEYSAGMKSIVFIMFLGFADDVLDFPWRYKMILPAIASVPIVSAYAGFDDATSVMIPLFLNQIFGIPRVIDLGPFYLICISMLIIFCSNSINIHAGVNGLEVGQSLIIAVFMLVHNVIEVSIDADGRWQHLLSMFLIIPFIGVSAGLLKHNWYPSQVFVGDSYTMMSGMILGVSGVLGHFSKTLILFFLPQLFNFLYSLPQLLRLFGLTCPRHRLPKYNVGTGLLEGIPSHHNLLNLCLCIVGPTTEEKLCQYLLGLQVVCGLFGLGVRYCFSAYLY